MEFTQKQKWMYLSFLVVIFSMFLPWAQLGIREISGWSNQAFMLLPAWFIPLYFVANRKSFPLLTRVSITVGALGLLGFDPAENGFSLLGNHYEFEVGAGPYAYTLGLLLGLYGEFIIIDASGQKSSIEIEKVVQSSYSEKKRFANIFRF
ncbi:hypothetical protein G8764_16730 [Pseudomaricurvus alcaniphilus]|uniref:hypothetical protein n=1 Tax=Pseudomaricurvus alcaniphilus TaxID=1166482 RepID=UPI00140CF622|nr:hypothetical protein [Pseudomaricurvus alcaniphilus]NHN38956.1 hypothetical protein [Pseudomaricurvus alcaniphilus]